MPVLKCIECGNAYTVSQTGLDGRYECCECNTQFSASDCCDECEGNDSVDVKLTNFSADDEYMTCYEVTS